MITITDNKITAESKEGSKASMPVGKFVSALCPPTPDFVLPDKVKFIKSSADRKLHIAVWEIDPGVHSIRWISEDSPQQYGPGTEYDKRELALPYIILTMPFAIQGDRIVPQTSNFECFYRNEPLIAMDQELYYPALLNCSKFGDANPRAPLSWLCTQYLNPKAIYQEEGVSRQLWRMTKLTRWCLLESGFNYSSEHHEGNSHYSDYVDWSGADARIKDVDKWQKESKKNPLFVLDLDWKETSHTMGQLVERTFKLLGAANGHTLDQAYLERVVFNAKG